MELWNKGTPLPNLCRPSSNLLQDAEASLTESSFFLKMTISNIEFTLSISLKIPKISYTPYFHYFLTLHTLRNSKFFPIFSLLPLYPYLPLFSILYIFKIYYITLVKNLISISSLSMTIHILIAKLSPSSC